jgi:hypothetical protein
MKQLLMVLAAGSIAACASRTEDQAGAAPEMADTTGVTHAIDTARTGPPGTGGRPGDATITTDSVLDDTVDVQVDTSYTEAPSPVSTPQDTLGPQDLEGWETDTTGQFGTDTTGAQAP